jgi:hypothetical protein
MSITAAATSVGAQNPLKNCVAPSWLLSYLFTKLNIQNNSMHLLIALSSCSKEENCCVQTAQYLCRRISCRSLWPNRLRPYLAEGKDSPCCYCLYLPARRKTGSPFHHLLRPLIGSLCHLLEVTQKAKEVGHSIWPPPIHRCCSDRLPMCRRQCHNRFFLEHPSHLYTPCRSLCANIHVCCCCLNYLMHSSSNTCF